MENGSKLNGNNISWDCKTMENLLLNFKYAC